MAIALLSLFVNVRQENRERTKLLQGPMSSGGDRVSTYTSRFVELRRILPPRGVVGYFSHTSGQEQLDDEMYYLTQYALAPVVVDRTPNHPLVVGNFPGALPPAEMFLVPGLSVKADLGHGVMLLKGSH
jgi:hypothetical protein